MDFLLDIVDSEIFSFTANVRKYHDVVNLIFSKKGVAVSNIIAELKE